MEILKGSVIVRRRSYKRQLKRVVREYTKERYKIITNDKNIFQNQDMIVIMRETDFNKLNTRINDYNALETENNDLKSTINKLTNKIKILEDYTKYLELESNGHSNPDKSNYFTQ